MANNVAATVATDDVAGVHYQYMKLADGTEDSSAVIPGDATNGLFVNVTKHVPGTGATNIGKAEDAAHTTGDVGVMMLAVRAAAATDRSAGNTDGDYEPLAVDAIGRLWTHEVGHRAVFKVNPTIDTTAYGAGDIAGGIQTIANWALTTAGSAILESVTIHDADGEGAALELLFFDATPSGGTYADQGAPTWAAGDPAKLIGRVAVGTADYSAAIGGDKIACLKNIMLPLQVAATSLFMLVITVATPTYTAATDLHIHLGARY